MRKGYDCRITPWGWLKNFSKYVEDRHDEFMHILNDGERVCGEWMIKTHTLSYKLKHEPFIVFDIIRDNKRSRYLDMIRKCHEVGFMTAGLVHIGESIPIDVAMSMLGKGYHDVVGGKPEGIVYRYENKDGYWFSGKYVANPLLGNEEVFEANKYKFNKYKGVLYNECKQY